jgi:hypothetical protein
MREYTSEDMSPDFNDWNSIVSELIAVQAHFIYNPQYRGCVEYIVDLATIVTPKTGDFAIVIETKDFWYYDTFIGVWQEISGSGGGVVIAKRALTFESDATITLFSKTGIANLTVRVTEAFDGTTLFSIVNVTDTETIVATADVDLGTVGEYIVPIVKSYSTAKVFVANLIDNNSSQGKLEVVYVV